jgi:hypothetical protein
VEKWYDAIDNSSTSWKQELANAAAQWGSDKELEACCEWMQSQGHEHEHTILYSFRRPKPPSMKQQALTQITQLVVELDRAGMRHQASILEGLIRRALEAIPK